MQSILLIGVIIIIVAIIIWSQPLYKPKKIWTFWDNPDSMPRTVTKCIERMRLHNPLDEVILLTKKNFKGYVTIPEELITHPNFNDMPARFADLVRIWVLAEHGGIWVDSSIIVNESFDWVFPWFSEDIEFSGFYIDESTNHISNGVEIEERNLIPVIENWFFACKKGSPFVRMWRDEFSMIGQFPSVHHYLKSRVKKGVDIQKITKSTYFAMHISAQTVLQINRYPIHTLLLRKAEDGSILNPKWEWFMCKPVAPFRYLVAAKWNSIKALEGACVYGKEVMVKIRGTDRNELEKRDDLIDCLLD